MRKPSSSSSAEVAAGGTPCCSKVGLKRGPWTPEEDEVLASYIQREGEGRWRTLPKRAGLLRCGKSCRLRWMNYLRPDVKRGRIAPDEEDLILRLHRLLGNRWSLIAGRIPGRTDNEIKNYWNTHLSKKLISQGIDPRTHKPLSTNNPTILSSPELQEAPELPTPAAPAPNPSFNPHGHHIYTAVGESEGFSGGFSLQQDHNNYFNEINLYSSERWKLTEGFAAVDYQRSNREISNEEGFIDCYGDEDVFSSFLNSLINEDAYLQQQQQCPLDYNNDNQNNNNSISTQVAKLDTPISSAANLGMRELWAGSLSSPASLDQDISGKFIDHVGKHF